MTGRQAFIRALEAGAQDAAIEIGRVLQVSGGGSQVTLDGPILGMLQGNPDPTLAMAGNIGSHIKMRVGDHWLVAVVRSMRLAEADGDLIVADVDFLGEGMSSEHPDRFLQFRRGVTRYPVPGTRINPVDTEDLKQMFATADRAHVEIGTVYPTTDIRAALYVDALLGKHFALLGSTGTGKSTATALILHRICELAPNGHIVMIDPHGEYADAFTETGAIFDVGNLAMPYWLMNFEEHCEVLVTSGGDERQVDCDILAKCLLTARSRNRAAEGLRLTVDSPVPYLLTDLTAILQNEMGKLDKAGTSAPYMRLKTKIDEIRADPRYTFMFSGMLVGDTMADFLAKIFRLPGNGKPISIIDVSGVPSDIVSVVVSMLSRMVFDYAIWARGEEQRPVLFVCEEAHRYVPSDSIASGSAVRTVLERIAKEGRKYGVSLGLITQRPSDLAEGVLSQCGTIIAMRLNNDRDQGFVKSAMPEGARAFLDSIPALRNREAIICGEGVAIPIRVCFDDLHPDKRPASHDPVFSELWRREGGETEMLSRIIQRWRTQGR